MSEVDKNPLVMRAKKENWRIYSLQGGIERITEALRAAVLEEGGEIHTSSPATRLQFTKNGVKVSTKQEVYEADHVVCTIPAKALAGLLTPDHYSLSCWLDSIKAVPIAVINLEYAGHVIPPHLVQSFGYITPSHQKSKILGVVFDSSVFPELNAPGQPTTRITVMMGGQWFIQLFGYPGTVSQETLKQTALGELKRHLGISAEPMDCLISVHKDAIPQYTSLHYQRLRKILSYCRSECRQWISVTGSSYFGISVNDCIINSLKVTDHLLRRDSA